MYRLESIEGLPLWFCPAHVRATDGTLDVEGGLVGWDAKMDLSEDGGKEPVSATLAISVQLSLGSSNGYLQR